jgi:hypothetical protein
VQDALERIITFSHWKSQSYFYEQTVDLIDFCGILESECKSMRKAINDLKPAASLTGEYKALYKAAGEVATHCFSLLETCRLQRYVIDNDWCGPDFRFSQGTAVFFPWTRLSFLSCNEVYSKLAIGRGGRGKWLRFIGVYTSATMRRPVGHRFMDKDRDKPGGQFRTGGQFRDELDILKSYFSSYKNFWTVPIVSKAKPGTRSDSQKTPSPRPKRRKSQAGK